MIYWNTEKAVELKVVVKFMTVFVALWDSAYS